MKKILYSLSLLPVVVIVYFLYNYLPQLPVASGYAAKKMCSCIFIAERSQESIQSEDLDFGPLGLTRTKVNFEEKYVTSSLFGLSPKIAMYREGVGCVLLDGADDHNIRLALNRNGVSGIWPAASSDTSSSEDYSLDVVTLEKAIGNAFDDLTGKDSLKTRAVVVVHGGDIVAEKYAEGFDRDTEILGWSMTKSITAALIGILVKNGRLGLQDNRLFEEWKDERSKITLRDMLQMQSGLEFEEDYNSLSDATRMLYLTENVSSIPLAKPIQYEPGTHWSYSSGTTNLLSKLIRNQYEDHKDYLRLPYDSLFHRIGMSSAVLETDESGHYIASSYCYATPRDWARFGLLFLNYGNWHGDQVVDSSWVDFVRTPSTGSRGIYGGHFWLNQGQNAYPDVPGDLYSCNGFQGQRVFIIPSYDLVIVRMGLAEEPVFDFNRFLKDILQSFSPSSG